ncbi:hypothetical protein DB346_14460 [Verrucomicrobia bacterium LW23]|nr:hypothetical protein DB346_14460 [Verrucomicrobia bacterium LW23]
MSHLIVLGFDTTADAFRMRGVLAAMQTEENLLELEDAVVVSKSAKGVVRLHQPVNLTLVGALGGAFCGGALGVFFWNPLLGAALGAASGAASGLFSDIGVKDELMRDVGKNLDPGTAALFVRVRTSPSPQVHAGLRPYAGLGRLLQTSMPRELEDDFRAAIEGTPPPHHPPGEESPAPTTV